LLKQAAPGLARVAIMFNPDDPLSRFFVPAIEAVAPALGVEVTAAPVRSTGDIETALASFAGAPHGGLVMWGAPFTGSHEMLIADLARRYRVPSISARNDFAKDGGLMGYGPTASIEDQYRQAATYVDRILKGSKPGDLPVQAPINYTLVINLKTAKALGLTIPETLLASADEVIQ
jgi:putative tryptophan/tyrosine transport system substrate-binding protein